jgi:hypothetical protein
MISCYSCRHFFGDHKRCCAFWDGIPDEILSGKIEHCSLYPGDRGIQYAPYYTKEQQIELDNQLKEYYNHLNSLPECERASYAKWTTPPGALKFTGEFHKITPEEKKEAEEHLKNLADKMGWRPISEEELERIRVDRERKKRENERLWNNY